MNLKRRYHLLIIVPVLVVLINAWVASSALAKLFDAERWLAHTLEVLTATSETQLGMSATTNAARGYLLSDSPRLLERYKSSRQEVLDHLAHVTQLTKDNTSQQKRMAFLRERIEARLREVDGVLGIRLAHPGHTLSLAEMMPLLSDGADDGPSVRYVLQEVQAEERRLLADRYDEAHSARRRVVLTLATASSLDLVFLVLAYWLLARVFQAREEVLQRSREVQKLNTDLNALNTVLEERVQQRTQELEVSNQELQAFSYSVSHDLRAPLRTIDGFSLALAEDFGEVLNDEGKDYIRRVRAGVQRMGTLIDALLQLSRVTRADIQRAPVNLSRIAASTFQELMQLEGDRVVTFLVEPDMEAEADGPLMRVAFQNLLGNALKFTSKTTDARIEVGRRMEGSETVYFIRDNGAGFDMQYVDRLFTAFQRLHGDRDFTGSGIGLATVSRIIRRHHGHISAEGAIGTGAVFSFTLNE